MPPLVVLALGALGAAALVKRLATESRRVNAELDALRQSEGERNGETGGSTPRHPTLRRDPSTGDYRPHDS